MGGEPSLGGKTAVLTGAGGFLGRNLLPLLMGQGVCVAAVTSRSREALCRIAGVDESTEALDVVSQADRSGISSALSNADVLINGGFPRSGDGCRLAEGMEFIQWLFKEAAARGARSIINVSSQSVYDQYRSEPATEETPVCPQSAYAVAKYATELMLNGFCRGVPHTNIRLASLIGPGFDQRVLNKMILSAQREGRIEVSEQGSQFGYLDCSDAADGIVALVSSRPADWLPEYNLGPSDSYTLTRIAVKIKECGTRYGLRTDIVITEAEGTPVNTSLNSEHFSALTGWRPLVSLEGSVERILRFQQR